MKVIIVCGGLDYSDAEYAFAFLDKVAPECLLVIQGAAKGADQIGRDWAKDSGIHCATVPARWDRFGKRAGPYRNTAMLRLRHDAVIAFPGGSGTAHMVAAAKRAGIPVIEAPGRE